MSEGVVVGMVSGSADTQGWTSVGRYFILWGTARMKSRDVCFTFSATHNQKSPIFGIQLHFLMLPQCSCIQGFYLVTMKGLDIIETNGGKVAIGPIAILAIGEVQDQSHTTKE